jgi:methionine synthase II (cobalamin-independent)
LKGIHCCGNTDWPVLLETSADIINFDTYNYAESMSLYPAEVKKFLAKNGAIAWGIVPNDAEALAGETVASLKDRLEEAMAPFTRNGIRFKQLIEQGLLTPSCTLTPLSEEAAARALELLTELSMAVRKAYL